MLRAFLSLMLWLEGSLLIALLVTAPSDHTLIMGSPMLIVYYVTVVLAVLTLTALYWDWRRWRGWAYLYGGLWRWREAASRARWLIIGVLLVLGFILTGIFRLGAFGR